MLIIAPLSSNWRNYQHKHSDSLAIASTKPVCKNLDTLKLIPKKHCQTLYQQDFVIVEPKP
ncbi:hypothetical protein IQ244_06930 [Nostoc sp. LEGE 06077]|nr:hypothetical protein [Nostoc sp. LEGE 06077]